MEKTSVRQSGTENRIDQVEKWIVKVESIFLIAQYKQQCNNSKLITANSNV